MSNLSMVEATLPPGFRFHPRDEELVCDYLMKKVSRCDHLQSPLLIEVDLNKCEPWDIPEMACVGGKEWYFYSQRDRKYATGLRTNRATNSGYWKATGKDRSVLRKRSLVGMRKTLVFYQGRAPKGKKTDWVMHEFRLEGPLGPPKPSSPKEDWVLCRVFCKNKEIGGKQGGGTSSSSFQEDTSSSSLPPLMETYGTISFNQTQPDPNQEYEQVPCFSMFTSPDNAPTSNFSPMNFLAPHPLMDPIVRPSAKVHATANLSNFGTIPVSPDLSSYLNQTTTQSISCEERKVIKAFVSQFNKMENVKESSSYGEGISDQSFLSDIGLPTMWYQG